ADGEIEFITSLPLGAVVLSERYHATDPIGARDLKRLVKYVRRSLADALEAQVAPAGTLVGSGGTITALAGIIAARRDPGLASVHRYTVRRAELIHLLAELAGSSARQRAAIKGMPESRVDIILAGAVVVDEAMRALGANELVVNARGIREGIVIDTIQRERGASAPFDRMQSVREFARRCHADMAHAEQVRALSLDLFDHLAEPLALDGDSRYLLETAALLHDVGYHIAYERHHRHSYHLISYAEIPGFSSRELGMVAAMARYHRGALPKPKHEALRDLDRADRETVVRLAALLRLADGLDRSRGQRVSGIRVGVTGARVAIALEGEGPLDAEVHGAARKADLFERAFSRRVDVKTAMGSPADP
ncbi:MAG: HD domain-containing protein, partial [Coriobacteriia bacterium]|nr:HD domain-containing protein [Coriobacteriia bacterium]